MVWGRVRSLQPRQAGLFEASVSRPPVLVRSLRGLSGPAVAQERARLGAWVRGCRPWVNNEESRAGVGALAHGGLGGLPG